METKLDIYRAMNERDFSELFVEPPALFRGAPFWSWNTKLNIDQLKRQIDVFKKMGIGGFHMHSRVGMNTPYLSDEFMAAVKACVDKAESDSMIAWLYDEDRWPSGAAGGLVTCDPQYRARHILFTPRSYEDDAQSVEMNHAGARSGRTGNGRLLAVYAVSLTDGVLAGYRRLANGESAQSGEDVWYAYLETAAPSSWFNNQTYVDTLNPRAIQKFVEVTHERYREVVGDRFGTVIPGIFTDEPQFTHKQTLAFATQKCDVTIPFTDDFTESYRRTYGENLLDSLPEVFWELPDGRVSTARYRYHDHVAERFAQAFADTIGEWCEANGIVLAGHLMEEPTLLSQTNALGDAMRSYRSFQLPGIDMLCDYREFTTAKQAQSASHQYGRNGVMSELYGVTGWDFDFAGYKCQGDWQAALGVTVRVHHLSWVSMEGEAKRDYPPSILHQSPWWEKYSTVESHFARINVALTRGRPRVRVGLIHPVESFWLCYGPQDQTAMDRDEREYTFRQVTEWLLFGLIDFDYICESLLPDLNSPEQTSQFTVGAMAYDVVLVPPMRTIRTSTLERLEAFVDGGGNLVFAGEIPSLVDAVPSDRARNLAERSMIVDFTRPQVLTALSDTRDVEVVCETGQTATNLVYQLRDLGDGCCHFFLCNSDRETGQGRTIVRLRGEWAVAELDTATGETAPLPARRVKGFTEVDWMCHPHGHLLLRLTPPSAATPSALSSAATDSTPTQALAEREPLKYLDSPVPVTLSEPNALLLDQPEWRLDGGEWRAREEILRIDDQVRDVLGLPRRGGQMAQPWTEAEDPTVLATLELRFVISCEASVASPRLAIEQPESIELELDGQVVAVNDEGWWVDESLRTVALPTLEKGDHDLLIRIAYHRKSNVEWVYLLGDFGVRLAGRDAVVTTPVRSLAFGDWTRQGLPFYTGNATYHCEFELANSANLGLRTPHFSGAMLEATLDGGEGVDIAFAPYAADLGGVAAGHHTLDVTVFGNRHNAFGALHWAEPGDWVGPGAWRSSGDAWCYEYELRPLGLLSAPRVTTD